jgi:transposase-like protein
MAKGQIQLKRLTETEARELLEGLRWANGKVCPHCGNCDQERIVTLGQNKNSSVRPGLYRCKECRKQFTVTVGTVMERSKVPLRDWVYVFAAICASKKGISAHQVSRELGCQYKTAWFMCHRVRLAMRTEAMGKLMGTVSVDETYVGGKPRNPGENKPKLPVVALVEKGGRARSRVTTDVKASTLRKFMVANIDRSATIMTDEFKGYASIGKSFARHDKVNHSQRQFVGNGGATSNEVESYFATQKRGIYGTFHHVSPQHLQRFVDEFDFRWSNREMSDTERTFVALSQTGGKRLMYRQSAAEVKQ